MAGKRQFGSVRRLNSKRWQARYTGPDGKTWTARTADGRPLTFDTKQAADGYLSRVSTDIQADRWKPPDARPLAPPTLRQYAEGWLTGRDLAVRTRAEYAQMLRDHIYPAFGDVPVPSVTPAAVRAWHADLKGMTGPTMRAHAYGLLRTLMNTAVSDEVISASPCRIRGAGQVKRVIKVRPATLIELETIVTEVPARYKLMVLLGAWCALRFGELAELRRSDVDVKNGVIHVRRGVVRVTGQTIVKDPKSDAGKRDVNIPPHLLPLVKDHLRDHVAIGKDALIFPARSGGNMSPSALQRVYAPARKKAGRPDLRFHDLRHTGAVLAAATGATLAELMARLGHSTPQAALRYQHAAQDRDKAIAAALSKLAEGSVTPITAAKSKRKRKEVTG